MLRAQGVIPTPTRGEMYGRFTATLRLMLVAAMTSALAEYPHDVQENRD